jgi:CBS domain-containing protein
MFIQQLLKDKGSNVITARVDAKAAEVVQLLKRERIGAVVVMDADGNLAGIISERDIACGLADHGAGLLDRRVDELMTAKVVTCGPADGVDEVMAKMTAGRFRHLPVLDQGKMVGIISIGDVVKHRLQELEAEASQLQSYIAGAA